MHSLSLDNTIVLANADYARTFQNDSSAVRIPLRLGSTSGTWKVFAPLFGNLQGWSLTTESGKRCYIETELNGIPAFPTGDFQNHIPAMPILMASKESAEYASLSARCDQPVNYNDKFHLAAQLYRLPAAVSPENRSGSDLLMLNFTSSGIPVQ